jgi:hypothetical protein
MTEPVVITIRGGFTDGVDRDHGSVGGASLYREPGERAVAFLDRLIAVAKAGSHGVVTIGGFANEHLHQRRSPEAGGKR